MESEAHFTSPYPFVHSPLSLLGATIWPGRDITSNKDPRVESGVSFSVPTLIAWCKQVTQALIWPLHSDMPAFPKSASSSRSQKKSRKCLQRQLSIYEVGSWTKRLVFPSQPIFKPQSPEAQKMRSETLGVRNILNLGAVAETHHGPAHNSLLVLSEQSSLQCSVSIEVLMSPRAQDSPKPSPMYTQIIAWTL